MAGGIGGALSGTGTPLGLVPAGEGGEYFQYLPLYIRSLDSTSTMTVGDEVFRVAVDFIGASAVSSPRQLRGEATIYGGMVLDTANVLTPDMTCGKIVVLRNFSPQRGQTQAQLNAMQQTPAAQSASTVQRKPQRFGDVPAQLNPSGQSRLNWHSDIVHRPQMQASNALQSA